MKRFIEKYHIIRFITEQIKGQPCPSTKQSE